MQVKKQQLELDMEKETGSKLGKEYVKAVYYHPAYLINMQSTSCEMPGWMKHKLDLRLPISITSDMQKYAETWRNINNLRNADDTTLIAESEDELKRLF